MDYYQATHWLEPGKYLYPQGQNSLTLSPVHSFLVSTPNDDFNFDVYYDNLDWLSTDPQAPAGLNQLTINMSYVCPYITSELPEVMVGFSCDIPNDFSAIDDEQTLFNALCDHSGFMLLTTITEGSPILSTSYSLSTQSGGSSMCETSIMELNIANIGNDCLDNTTVSISPGQYTINNLNYSLASNNPLVLTSGQIALSNSTSTSCSNGLFAGNHGVLSLDIGPSCNFNYGSSGQILVTVQELCM